MHIIPHLEFTFNGSASRSSVLTVLHLRLSVQIHCSPQ